jgi:hypothetical protein
LLFCFIFIIVTSALKHKEKWRKYQVKLNFYQQRVKLFTGSDARNTPLNGKLSRLAHISMEVKESSQNYCRFLQQIPNEASEAKYR